MKRSLIIFFLITPMVAYARMGETRSECEKRYGKPISTREDAVVVFEKNNIEICAYFDASNRVERIEYKGTNLTYYVSKRLLKANADEDWRDVTPKGVIQTLWRATRAHLTALFNPDESGTLKIYPDDWDSRIARREQRLLDEKRRSKLREF